MATDNQASFDDEIDAFTEYVDSLATSLPLTMWVIDEVARQANEEFEQFRADFCTREIAADGAESFIPEDDMVSEYDDAFRKANRADLAYVAIPRGFLVSMVSAFDSYIGALMKICLRLHPELLSGSERVLTFAQLSQFASLDDARTFVLEREVDANLRRSRTEQVEWFGSRFKTQFLSSLDCWPEFIEITERRNLLVHTGGKVSAQYIENCRRVDAKLPDDLSIGKELHVDPEYLERAADRVFEIGCTLGHVLWRKLMPEELEDSDDDLIDVSYTLMTEQRYDLAARLLDFAARLKKYSSDECRRILVVNRALVTKLRGDQTRAIALMDAEDWSATGDKFVLANAAIRENVKDAVDAMRRIGKSGGVEKWQYRRWPLFAELRSNTDFVDAFEAIFGEPLNRDMSKTTTQRDGRS